MSQISVLFSVLLTTITLLHLQLTVAQECGRLVKQQVYDETNVAHLNEFPWHGQIYINTFGKQLNYQCNAVLVTRRSLLAPAHCFSDGSRYKAAIVVLGDSNYKNAMYEQDCDDAGECAPVPKQYEIDTIAVHPNFDRRQRFNDIAVVHVKQTVEYNEYIQPICLPPATMFTADLVTQYFIFAGFAKQIGSEERTEKLKTVAHILPLKDCEEILRITVPPTNICASSLGMIQFFSGSALMGINVENTTLTNYYLIGLLSYGTDPSTRMLDVFNRVSSHTNWIQSNLIKN